MCPPPGDQMLCSCRQGQLGTDHTPFVFVKPKRRAPAVLDACLPFLPGTGGFHCEPTGGQGKATGKLKPLGQQSKEGVSAPCQFFDA